MKKKDYSKPLMFTEKFIPQSYCSGCQWRAVLHCGVYGNSTYYDRISHYYYYAGKPHGEACQNTVVTVRKEANGNLIVTGQEVPKGSPVTYVTTPEFHWGQRGVSAPQRPANSEVGAIYSLAEWNSEDAVHPTGNYQHIGYVQSWEAFTDGTSNVS